MKPNKILSSNEIVKYVITIAYNVVDYQVHKHVLGPKKKYIYIFHKHVRGNYHVYLGVFPSMRI